MYEPARGYRLRARGHLVLGVEGVAQCRPRQAALAQRLLGIPVTGGYYGRVLLDRVEAYLYGHRMYEVMRYWETALALTDRPPVEQDFARIWRAADKIVYSSMLRSVSSARTRIERDFDPEAVRRMKSQAVRDISVGGPDLAAQALRAGLVDECRLFVAPIVVGGAKRSLPTNVRLELELLDERRFEGGVVYLHYRTRT